MSKDTKNNTGEENTGYFNSGDYNSGDRNSGYCNSGYWNSGNFNSGYCNSGDRNSGYGNSTNRENGIFNSEQGTLRIFNKPTNKKWEDIDHPHFNVNEFYLTKWIPEEDMTDEEKKADPEFCVRKGYLKGFTYKEVWANFWRDTGEENRKKFLNLPNFDWKIFTEITGLEADKDDTVEVECEGKKVKISRKSAKALNLIP